MLDDEESVDPLKLKITPDIKKTHVGLQDNLLLFSTALGKHVREVQVGMIVANFLIWVCGYGELLLAFPLFAALKHAAASLFEMLAIQVVSLWIWKDQLGWWQLTDRVV